MDLIDFAYHNGLIATESLGREEQRQLGQYMTPPVVARFMAQRCVQGITLRSVSVLDPAAGSGVLAAAIVDALLRCQEPPRRISVRLCEIDHRLIPKLRSLAARMRSAAAASGVQLTVAIAQGDFLLAPATLARKPCVDIVVANPPYFKLNGSDPRAKAHAYAVHGQPNIYGLFMAACTELLVPGGRWCFITPRSWTNGSYFSALRRHLYKAVHFDAMHLFESRNDHFKDDAVLQEAMITWATAQVPARSDVLVSLSQGANDLGESRLAAHPVHSIIGQSDPHVIALPTSGEAAPWSRWGATLDTYGIRASTGPVIAFRAAAHLRERASRHTAPLLWLQHISPMKVTWPIQKKREHIAANAQTAWMLVPNANMVVMRRFSPKEDKRRITAAAYVAGTLPGPVVGLENHTNYLWRPGGALSVDEARGLAAFLSSEVVDSYLRSVAGSTQVNAADLRALPLPPLPMILAIGRSLGNDASLATADAAVAAILCADMPYAEAV